MPTRLAILAQSALLFAATSQFYFDSFHNRKFDRQIKKGLDTLNRAGQDIKRIADDSQQIVNDQRQFLLQLMSGPSMLDEIAKGFGAHMSSRAFGRNSEPNKKERKQGPGEVPFDSFGLVDLPRAKQIFPAETNPQTNSLEMIMDGVSTDELMLDREKKPGQNSELNLKKNLKKWRFTSRDGHKASAMSKSMTAQRQSPDSDPSQVRNYVMGFSQQDKLAQIDLNSLLNRLESGKSRAEQSVPEGLEIVFKDQNGQIIRRTEMDGEEAAESNAASDGVQSEVVVDSKAQEKENSKLDGQEQTKGNVGEEQSQPKAKSSGKTLYLKLDYQVSK